MTKRSAHSEPSAGFVDIEKLEDVSGIVAIISQRRASGALTCAVFKEFERDGQIQRTSFVGEHLIDAYIAMLEKVRDRMEELRNDEDNLPIKRADARARKVS